MNTEFKFIADHMQPKINKVIRMNLISTKVTSGNIENVVNSIQKVLDKTFPNIVTTVSSKIEEDNISLLITGKPIKR